MTQQEIADALLRDRGTLFATGAGIELADEPDPLWQLLVMAQLLSTRISSDIALATARELWAAGWTTPSALRGSTWNQRVTALGRGRLPALRLLHRHPAGQQRADAAGALG